MSADLGITWDFDPKGREAYQTTMRVTGYTERDSDKPVLQLLIDKKSVGGFWCYNCEYLQGDQSSPTGWRCGKYGYPDRPHGCCVGQETK